MINDASVVIGGGNWGIKEADVLGYKLINDEYYARDIDFANSTAAGTYTDSTGVVRKAPYNLLQYSEQFDNAAWTKTAVTVGNNTTVAPNGTLTADTLSVGVDATNARHRLHSATFTSQIIGTTYTATYYLKANQHQWIQILGNIGYSNGVWANFDLINGTIGNTGGVDTTASIESVGDGWYKCVVSGVATGTFTTGFEVIVINNTNGGRYPLYQSTQSADVCYIWGAQLVEGTEALPYFPTTTRLNVPRIDYRNADGSLSTTGRLLLEPQRTNLALRSEEFNLWTEQNGATVVANTGISPNGTQNADTINTINTFESRIRRNDVPFLNSTTYTYSVFIKNLSSVSGDLVALNVNNALVAPNRMIVIANYDLNNNTITTTLTGDAVTGFVSGSNSGRVENYGNGWYRISVTWTTGTSAAQPLSIIGVGRGGGGTPSFLAWGAQLEAGSYATSYIPTTTATVTRNADSASRTGVSSWIGQTQGTIFLEGSSFNLLGSGVGERISVTDGTFNNRVSIDFQSNGIVSLVASNSTTAQTGSIVTSNGAVTANNRFKIAVAYDGTNSRLYVNGTAYTTITGTVPIFSGQLVKIEFDQGNGGRPFYGRVDEAMLFLNRLTNSQLQSLTTL